MRCPNEETLLLLASGEVSSRERRRIQAHTEGCARCRREYEVARRAVRLGFPALEASRGTGGRGRIDEILAVVRASCEPAKIRALRSHPGRRWRRIAVVAAAVVVLTTLMARYLGEWDAAVARFEATRGAHLRSTDGPTLRRVEAEAELSPGDQLFGLDDSRAGIRWPEGGELTVAGSPVLVIDRGGRRPAAHLARGVFLARSEGDEPFTIALGETVLRIRGTAELVAEPRSGADLRAWAADQSLRIRDSSLAGASATPRIEGRIHVLEGRVEAAGGVLPTLSAGEEILTGTGGHPTAAWVGTASFYAGTAAGLLDEAELRRVQELLPPDRDVPEALVETASAPSCSDADRGLALWLLGEIGDPRSRAPVGEIADSREHPSAVRAAAWRVRALLGDWSAVNMEALREESAGEDPVVAEAICQALRRSPDPSVPEALAAFAAEPDRPAFLRSLAAATAHFRGAKIPPTTIERILSQEDGLDGWSLLSRVLDARNPAHQRILLALAREDSPLCASVLSMLGGARVPGAEDCAARVLQDSTSPRLLRSAAHYLRDVRAPRIADLVRGLLESTVPGRRLAGIQAARLLREEDLPERNEVLQRVLRDPGSSSEALMTALSGLGAAADPDRTLEFAESDDPSLREAAQEGLVRIAARSRDFAASPEYRRVLLQMMREASSSTRRLGGQALGSIAPEFAVSHVREVLHAAADSHAPELLLALDQAARTGQLAPASMAAAVKILERFLADRSRADLLIISFSTLSSLLEAGSPEARRLLVEFLDAPGYPAAVPILAARGLARDPDPTERAALLARVLDREDDAARALAHALLSTAHGHGRVRLGRALATHAGSPFGRAIAMFLAPQGPGAAIEHLRSGPWALSELFLATILSPAVAEEHRDALAALLTRKEAVVRRMAAQRLAMLHPPVPELAGFESDPDPAVRLAALSSRLRGPSGTEALPRVLDTFERWDLPGVEIHIRRGTGASGKLEPELRRFAETADLEALADELVESLRYVPAFQAAERAMSGTWAVDRAVAATQDAARRLGDREGVRFARRVLAGREVGDAVHALRALRIHGGRADVPLLVSGVAATAPSDVAAEAAFALERLVGLSPAAIREDPTAIPRWWEKRRYALDVPVVDSPKP